MVDTKILSGIEASHALYDSLHERISSLKDKGVTPGLAAILVGEDPASQIYVRNKTKRFDALGLKSELHRLDKSVSEEELLDLIAKINSDDSFHGILVQLPLPKHIDSDKVIHAIHPTKDVDGFHPENAGLLSIGRPRFIPCTPKGIMFMLKHFNVDLNGKHVVVVGRSNIVGTPVSIMLSRKAKVGNATVTLTHSRTRDLTAELLRADIVIAAIGIPEFVTGDQIKDGAVIIDVGINRVDDDTRKSGYRLVGDVEWDSVSPKASYITPVPGGVGPMTVTSLLMNTLKASANEVYG